MASIALACRLLVGPVVAGPTEPEAREPAVSTPIPVVSTAASPAPPADAGPSDPPPTKLPPSKPEAEGSEPPGYPRFRFSGWLQTQFNDGELGSPKESSPFPAANGIGPSQADNHLFFRRIRPAFALKISPGIELQTQLNLDPAGESVQVMNALLKVNISGSTSLCAGRFKVPFGWEGLRGANTTNTIERSDLTCGLYTGRDPGLSLTHRAPHLGNFTLGGFLAESLDDETTYGKYDIYARAQFHLDDNFWIGASGQTGTFRINNTAPDLPIRRLGTELQYSSGPLKVEAEAIWSDGYNSISQADTPASGYYGTVVVRAADPLDVVLSYDRFDPDTGHVNQEKADNTMNARDRKVLGLNYYLDRKKLHRLMVNYEWKQDLEGPSLHTSGFRVRYQIAW